LPLLCCSSAPFFELGTGFSFSSVKMAHSKHTAEPEITVPGSRFKGEMNTVATPVSHMLLQDIRLKCHEPGTAEVR